VALLFERVLSVCFINQKLGTGEWLMTRDFAAGTLVRILPEWTFDSDGGVYLVRPSVQFAPARTEAFVAWISDQFKHGMLWSQERPAPSAPF
jgi:DNA-binding transcriptional LysR family regulator